jgi:plastocyanin
MHSTKRSKARALAFAIGAAALLAGCQGAVRDTAPYDRIPKAERTNLGEPAANEVRIAIENFVFSPAEVTVAAGTKVTWINKDEAPHTATSTDEPERFNSGGLDTDDTFSFVFNEKGSFPYFCALHPHMKAQITVE